MKSYAVLFCVVMIGSVQCEEKKVATSNHKLEITPCKAADTECLKASAEKLLPVLALGVPDYGIMSMDPMHVEQVKTTQAGLNMDFRNTTVTGLKHCKVLMLKRSGDRMSLDLKCSVNMQGDYTLGGRLLIMPIEGDGQYTIKIRDIIVNIQFQVAEKMVDEKVYWTVKSWKHTTEVQKGVHFQFDKLFNGNEQLSKAVHTFANENWRDIFQEVAPPIVKAIVAQILKEITKLFVAVPIKDMVIE